MKSRSLLREEFFERRTDIVARELLGKYLVRRRGNKEYAYQITETEAYLGPEDLASHARHGKTKRNAPMHGPPGRFYVYLVYGLHYLLNVVTGPAGVPAAVLIRGVEGYPRPGLLTKALAVNLSFTTLPSRKSSGLWIEDRGVVPSKSSIVRGPRVGVEYAGPWAKKPLRFLLRETKAT